MRTAWTRTTLTLAAVMVLAACGRQGNYQACSFQMPCTSSAPLCLADTTATHHTVLFCSRHCTTPAATSGDCPDTAACVRLNGQDPICMKRCTATTDCDFANAQCAVLPESSGARVCAALP